MTQKLIGICSGNSQQWVREFELQFLVIQATKSLIPTVRLVVGVPSSRIRRLQHSLPNDIQGVIRFWRHGIDEY
jgi:hypothetical protein